MSKRIGTVCIALSAIVCLALVGVPAQAKQGPLSDEEVDWLKYMCDEEKLALDVYTFYSLEFPELSIFSNIASSEAKHLASVQKMIGKFNVPEAACMTDAPGVFSDPELQIVYDWMTEDPAYIYVLFESVIDTSTDLDARFWVGGLIEENEIADLADAIEATTAQPVLNVYSHLLRGSQNHLRSFASNLQNDGIEYINLVLTAEEVEDILDSNSVHGPHK